MLGRLLLVATASLALACGIAFVFYRITGGQSAAVKTKTKRVVVANAELAVGTRVRTEDLRVVSVPESLAPQSTFEKTDEIKDRVVTNLVLKDEPLVSSRLAAPGTAPGLAPMIPPGYRAVSVRVNDVIGVAGFIQPGMRVDVLASGHAPNTDDTMTRTVLQNVVVLSAGQVLTPEAKGGVINAQVVTLQVRPEEAEILMLTSGEGRIQLILRNSADVSVASTPGVHLKAIYNASAPETGSAAPRRLERSTGTAKSTVAAGPAVAAPAAVQKPRTIEVIRGTTRTEVSAPTESDRQSSVEKKITRNSYAHSILG
jgi:pilus assembly protein CpaB